MFRRGKARSPALGTVSLCSGSNVMARSVVPCYEMLRQ